MVKPESPCTKDCPRRSATCHSECQEYKDFERAQELFRNETYEAKEMNRKPSESRHKLFVKKTKDKHLRRG